MMTVALLLSALLIAVVIYLVVTGKPGRRVPTGHTHGEPHASGGTVALREALLSRELFGDRAPPDIRCAVMDVAVGNGVATLMTVSDGTVSLYLSAGGGILGGGAHANVSQAAERFRGVMGDGATLRPVTEWPLPTDGHAVFYVVTATETRASAAFSPEELAQPDHAMHDAWMAAQGTLTALRIASPG